MADSKWSWKDAAIAGLWAIMMASGFYWATAIKDGLGEVKKTNTEHIAAWGLWQIQYERERATTWRVIDRLCGYQGERLRKEGRLPDYFPVQPNNHTP